MKSWLMIGALALLQLSLEGCEKKAEVAVGLSSAPHGKGRYVGVGLYTPGPVWTQLKLAPAPAATPPNPEAATLQDDDMVIVVMDSNTGEMRQCGNLSGHCIGFNPWAKAATGAPAALVKHAQQLEEQARAEADRTVKVAPAKR